jgi:2-keto-3-deoxy-L-rhamnonate aldolase RhmA
MLRTLLDERAAIGTFLKLPRPEVVAILALSGYDFAICDLEHSQITAGEWRDVLQAGRAEGLPVVVRVPDLDRGLINRVLEAGAAGVQLPRTATAADSDTLASFMRYPPTGTRSMSQAQPAARYGAEPLVDYIERANSEALAVGQFETADLADNLDAAVAPLDVAFIGSLDLSIAAGHPGRPGAPEVTALIDRVAAAARRTGRHLGVFAGTAEAARTALAAGYRYVAVSADLSMLRRGASDLIAELRSG